MQSEWYFKLFNNIKEKHEVDFAELELLSLFGRVRRVRNFADILYNTSFKNFIKNVRIQDILAHELPYGPFHGFYAKREGVMDVSQLECAADITDHEAWRAKEGVHMGTELRIAIEYEFRPAIRDLARRVAMK